MKQYFLLVLLPVLAMGNGPDRGGYRWIDSDESGGPTFNWLDISSTGTQIPLVDDDNQGPFALGFSFDFYGQSFDSIRVCSDGWLSFNSESHQFHHDPIPDVRDPNNLLAPMWVDLNPSQGGSVYYLADTANGRFVMSWVDVPFYLNTDSVSFQVIIDTAGILFQYLRIPPSLRLGADSCTVGIENATGETGLEYYCDGTPTENQLHDSLAIRFYRLQHDACPTACLRPGSQVLAGDSIAPLVVVWNAGLSPATFPVTLNIGSGYQEEMTVTGLAPLSDTQLLFPVWVPAADTYQLQLISSLAGDEYPANDTLEMEVVGSYAGELRYDDGGQDTWFFKNGSPTNRWAAAVRFSVPYAHYRLRGASLFVDDVAPFSQVLVCPDSSGAPQLGSPYLAAESVGASLPQTWLEVATDVEVTTPGDIWLVAFWPQHATGPSIGEDRDVPIDGRTYYGSPTVRWIPYTTGDLMARLRIEGLAGISEQTPTDVPALRVSPNPFRLTAMVSLKPGAGSGQVRVRDVAGRFLRRLELTASGTAVWDGRDQSGRRLPAGAYFIEVPTGSGRRVVQVLMTR